ncbi:Vta1 like-domain-containing protein [Lipomyces japonicus]|uniref:Vta1 like-domain-containing protein n=1 Tax=Lipomyces japonicus TaxID=56871 RepID=UPI0034CD5E2F
MSLAPPPPSLKFISTYIARARELERADPVISYYCKYYAIEEALAAKVHQTDPIAAEYVTNLLDVVEQDKENLKEHDTITDEVVGQAYVEKFATRVFANADKDIQNKTTTKATALNLLAAASFLELLKLFGQPDLVIRDQIKYAKYHAARIIKAITAGKDPNDYDPRPPSPQPSQEQQEIESDNVLAVTNEQVKNLSVDEQPQFSPSSPRAASSQISPSAPASSSAENIYRQHAATPSAPFSVDAPLQGYHHEQKHVSKQDVQQIMDEAERFSLAQKHSKYAISALNYEDVDTAVKELRTALRLLGESV